MYLCTLFVECAYAREKQQPVIFMRKGILYIVFTLLACASASTYAQSSPYLCELGIQAGVGYYVGDASPHIFTNPLEAYGVQFRYKFTKRWALQVKVAGQRISSYDYLFIEDLGPVRQDTKWTNQMLNADVMAEFNFLRFGASNEYDRRIKPYTPYIFLGIGGGIYGDGKTNVGRKITGSGYLPFGIGFKWKFHDRVGLNIAWQHNIYFADDLEAQENLNDRYHMNGWNWMNCDLTGMLTVALVVEFAHSPKPCRICNTD